MTFEFRSKDEIMEDESKVTVHSIAPLLKRTVSYFDTVQVRMDKRVSPDVLNALRKLSGSLHLDNNWNVPHLPHIIQMHQPHPQIWPLLRALRDYEILINGLDVALDLETDERKAHGELVKFVVPKLIKRWHGKNEVILFLQTLYFMSGGNPMSKNLAAYWDLESRHKPTGCPCLHIEVRMRSSVPIKNMGIHNLNDLIGFDHREFWKKELCLRTVDIEKLGRQIAGRSKAKKPFAVGEYDFLKSDLMIGRFVSKYCVMEYDFPPGIIELVCSQKIIDEFRKHETFHQQTCMNEIPNRIFLPPVDGGVYTEDPPAYNPYNMEYTGRKSRRNNWEN